MAKKEMVISVLGDGSWGTTFAIHLAEHGHKVFLWSAFPEQAGEMSENRENKRFLPGFPFPENIEPISDIDFAVSVAELLVCAIPTQYIRSCLSRISVNIPDELPIISLSKGIESETLLRTTEIIAAVKPFRRIGGLWGPSHAEEVARRLPTTLVAASEDEELSRSVQESVSSDYLRVYVNDDLVGVETGGAVKNVIAIAAGILEGLGFGDNARSALITRGLAEMARLGAALGAKPITFMGLGGVGDLITTCVSPFGRNRHVGLEIGKGKTLDEVLAGMNMIAEGVETCKSVKQLAGRHGVEMPIAEAVYEVLFDGVSPRKATLNLMRRKLKHEMYGFEL